MKHDTGVRALRKWLQQRAAIQAEHRIMPGEKPIPSEAACEVALFLGNLSIEAMRERRESGQ